MKLSIVFITGRNEPQLERAVACLAEQAQPGDEIEIVVVDALRRPYEHAAWSAAVALAPSEYGDRRLEILITEPKPSIWQGPQRIVSADWWAASNARNTGACFASHDHLAFLDDRCTLSPGWLDVVRRYAQPVNARRVVCGAYDKWVGDDRPLAVDQRLEAAPAGRAGCGGAWLFGCTFALPTAAFLAVNGFEEGCDGVSMEDVILGKMLENARYDVDYQPAMRVHQDRTDDGSTVFLRKDKGHSPRDKSHAMLARFGTRRRTELTPDLRALRAAVLVRGAAAFPRVDRMYPHRDWYDNALIREAT